MRFDNLDAWLCWQETLHPSAIELGLERIGAVWNRLGCGPLAFPVITVAGTNGKGSCAAMLEAIYRAAGYRTGCYTSPHLLRYNERIRLDGRGADDDLLCAAFERVDAARGDSILTYFEFGTLAALDIFARSGLDVAILEVGLGGRLDAVNIVDPDVAIVTTIGRDHTEWLGNDLDGIAAEKAGIFRRARPVVVGHREPLPSLLRRARELDCRLSVLGRDFEWTRESTGWRWSARGLAGASMPVPALRGEFQYDNAATALTAVSCLAQRLPVPTGDLRLGLQRARIRGRFQVLQSEVTWILDVAHNAQAANALAANLASLRCPGHLHAVLGTLADKEPAAIAGPLAAQVDSWHLGQAAHPRALPVSKLRSALRGVDLGRDLRAYPDIEAALEGAARAARPGDCILAFGSFTTVEAALRRTHKE
ncbi:MAG: bifunctional tetrahydrofolate synthase/dihydrofolate synthase [Pseudomonadota bacterium]|nr:bifunctional tetrahydrofolate synthase/dihydrofolate synthase [Pseudomonadota bacterium]